MDELQLEPPDRKGSSEQPLLNYTHGGGEALCAGRRDSYVLLSLLMGPFLYHQVNQQVEDIRTGVQQHLLHPSIPSTGYHSRLQSMAS